MQYTIYQCLHTLTSNTSSIEIVETLCTLILVFLSFKLKVKIEFIIIEARVGLFVYTKMGLSPLGANISTYFSLRSKCWLRGGVGGHAVSQNLN